MTESEESEERLESTESLDHLQSPEHAGLSTSMYVHYPPCRFGVL